MKDQVMQLTNRGIKALHIPAGISYADLDKLLDNCIYGNYKLLYLSPERLQQELVLERLRQRNNMSDEETRRRINSQLPFQELARYAGIVVHNSGSISALREQVESLWNRVRGEVS